MTIYLPDDLAATVKQHDDLNVSAVCQEALRAELARREELAKLDKGMERHVVFVDRLGTDVAFTGKELHSNGYVTAYLTGRHRLAVYDDRNQTLYEYDSFDDLVAGGDGESELVAAVAVKLGEKHVVELDI